MNEPTPRQEPRSDLRRRRDELAEQVAELHWNLGGLTYEMAIRDHFRLDVLMRRAAMLQERDAELAELDRLLHMQESSIAGSCPSCGAVRSRGAVFCWQCGVKVMEQASGGVQATGDGDESGAKTVELDLPTTDAGLTTASAGIETAEGEAATVDVEDDRASVGSARARGATPQELGRPLSTNP
ncbi:MAG TPA: zinc ribbon domain-containing protein [Solirubrobacteraceae bacterium]|jgi:hypothetical protein|nr:zinc ribbon domain-containing protein [Solirubrobacteraceae bacterium]